MSQDGPAGAAGVASARARARNWLAAGSWLTALVSAAGAIALGPAATATPHVASGSPHLLFSDIVLPSAIAVAFASVGAVVVVRRSGHLVGWLLLVAGWMMATSQLVHGYAHHVMATRSGNLVLAAWAAQLDGILFLPAFLLLLAVLPLVFPDGRLPSPRWRVVAVGAAVVLPLGILFEVVLRPGPISSFPELVNPLGVAAVGAASEAMQAWAGPLVFGPWLVAAGAAIIVRLRRSDAVARQQFKWVALPMGLLLLFVPVHDFLLADAEGALGVLSAVVFVAAFGGLPVGIGLAVLRYRLYDIDRIVSRTVAYGLVTVTLLGVYAVSAVTLGSVMRLATGEAAGDLVVAASTLAVAALFSPLRRRAQRLVDRRFNRSRYNMDQTLAAFSARLRDNVDLDDMQGDLRTVVHDTFEPAAVTLWLPARPGREPEPPGHLARRPG